MSERPGISERLASVVITGAVENYRGEGVKTEGNQKAMDVLYLTGLTSTLGLSPDYPPPPQKATRT